MSLFSDCVIHGTTPCKCPVLTDGDVRKHGLYAALRLRLAGLVEEWRARVEPGSDAATWFMAATELESALRG